MPENASNDWLEVVKTRAQGIRVALGGIGVFVACVLVTIFGQLRLFEADRKAELVTGCFVGESPSGAGQASQPRSPACPAAADWDILQAAYQEFPAQQIDAELTPWNQFAIESTVIGSFVEGVDPKKFAGQNDPMAKFVLLLIEANSKTPLKPGTTSEISHFYLHLKDFDSNVKTIEGALAGCCAKTPFEALDRDRIIALANAYAFNLDSCDIQGEYAAQDLANQTFISELDRLRPSVLNAEGHPIMEGRFVQTLKDGTSLKPLTTLRQQLLGTDLKKFQEPNEAEMKKLIGYLMVTRFATLSAERNEDDRLDGQMNAILNGDTDSAINLPFLNLSVDLSAFAYLSGFLNLAFLGWIFWQARQMDDAANRYMAFADADRSRVAAALQGLPASGRRSLLPRTLLALLVSMPTLLGTLLLFAPLVSSQLGRFRRYSLFYLILPAVVFLLSLGLVRFIQVSNPQSAEVPGEPQGGPSITTT